MTPCRLKLVLTTLTLGVEYQYIAKFMSMSSHKCSTLERIIEDGDFVSLYVTHPQEILELLVYLT
jgi:hypothetical protein